MSTEENKKAFAEFWGKFTEADVDGALEYLDDNIVWMAMGREGQLPLHGQMNKEAVGQLIKDVKEMMPKGLQFKMTGWTAEGNRVAAEIESYGELTDGRIYNNFYHFLAEFKGDKLILIKEYMDTLHVKEIFID
jgi:hypothetical protein